jgi:hypothetical protein
MKRESSRDLKSVPHCYGQFGNSIYKRYVYISRCAQFICCGKKTSFVNIDPATLDEMMSEVPQSRVISQDVKATRMYAT